MAPARDLMPICALRDVRREGDSSAAQSAVKIDVRSSGGTAEQLCAAMPIDT